MGFQRSSLLSRTEVGLCLLVLVVGLASRNARAQATDVCGPSPAVKVALDQLPQQTPAQTDWQFHEQHLAAIQALLRQYPEDWLVQRAYIGSMRRGESEKEKTEKWVTGMKEAIQKVSESLVQ